MQLLGESIQLSVEPEAIMANCFLLSRFLKE